MKIKQQQFNEAQQVFHKHVLSAEKKGAILSRIYGDAPQVSSPVIERAIPSPYWSPFQHKALVGFVTGIVLVFGTTYASAQSLPGDALYGVKVRVLEPAISLLKFSSEARSEYNQSLLEKRAEELEVLEAQGEVSEEAELESEAATRRIIETLNPSQIRDNPVVEELLDTRTELEVELEIKPKVEVEGEVPISFPPETPQNVFEAELESTADVGNL